MYKNRVPAVRFGRQLHISSSAPPETVTQIGYSCCDGCFSLQSRQNDADEAPEPGSPPWQVWHEHQQL